MGYVCPAMSEDAATPSEDRPPHNAVVRVAGWSAVALLAAVVFILGFTPLRASHDEWWHLKTGKIIVENDYRLPETDVFTYTAADYRWDNHEWLSEVLMYLLWRAADSGAGGGWAAVILAKAALLAATWLLLWRFLAQRAGGGLWGIVGGLFLAVLAASVARRTFYPRPPVISYFFLTLYLYVLWLHRAGRIPTAGLFVLPLVMPLWANLHGGFVLGGICVAAYFAGEAIEALLAATARKCRPDLGCPVLDFFSRLTPPPPPGPRPFVRRALVYLVLGLAVGLASLLTPYGWRLYTLTHRVMRDPELVGRLSELMPPDLRYTWGYVVLVAFLAVGFIVLVGRTMAKRRTLWPPVGEILLVAFFFWQSSHHVRHLPLMGIAGAPLCAWFLHRAHERAAPARRKVMGLGLLAGASICSAWLVFFPGEGIYLTRWIGSGSRPMAAWERSRMLARGIELEPGSYPVRAVDFVRHAKLPGRMFNRNHLAGYLIWRLSPEHYRVFTDNRFDIFGGDFLMDELSVANGWPAGYLEPRKTPVPDWRQVIERWNIQWLFLERSEQVNEILARPGSGWVPVYRDSTYLIWLKDTPDNARWVGRYALR